MWWLALVACDFELFPGPHVGSISTLCDGCFSSSSTGSSFTSGSSEPPASGVVFLAELAPEDPDPISARAWPGTHAEAVGQRLVAIGDLDADGLRDAWSNGAGGAVMRSGDAEGVRFGSLQADPRPVGDVDADGAPDLAIGGGLDLASILPGAELAVGGAFEPGDGWLLEGGPAVGGPAPDLDLDGLADSAWIEPEAGGSLVHVLPGALAIGGLRREDAVATFALEGDAWSAGGSFDLGDLDGDGIGELGVARRQGNPYRAELELLVFSGASLAVGEAVQVGALWRSGGERPVVEAERLGDVDGDGLGDLAVAATDADASIGAIVSGAALRGSVELALAGAPIHGLSPTGALDAADLDGDGRAELLVVSSDGRGKVHRGEDLGAGTIAPAWVFEGGVSAVLAGLDEHALRVWIGDPTANLVP